MYLDALFHLIFPRYCPCCDRRMLPQEEALCLRCNVKLDRTHAEQHGNVVEDHLLGRFPFEHGTSFFYYSNVDPSSRIILQSKYGGRPWHNTQIAKLFAHELSQHQSSPDIPAQWAGRWPFDIDLLLPIPLHPWRLLTRQYNQSLAIAEGLREVWRIPIETHCLRKKQYTTSQVGMSREARLQHEAGSFTVVHPERLHGHHVLLIDDVLTTGATLTAASDALLSAVPDLRISFLTLAVGK